MKSPIASYSVRNGSDTSPLLQSSAESLSDNQTHPASLPTDRVYGPTVGGIPPPVIHANSGDSDESDSFSHTAVIVIVAVVVVACVAATVLVLIVVRGWWKGRKARVVRASPTSASFPLLEESNALDTGECSDSIPLSLLHPIREESRVLEPDAQWHCSSLCSINARLGGLAAMPCGSIMMWIPPGASPADQTIEVSYRPIANLCCLPRGVIPLACPLRVHPHGFKYSKPVILVFRVPGNFFPLRDEQIRLFHSDDEDSPTFSELKESSCRVFTLSDGHQYVTCRITSHCLVVPCVATPDVPWPLVAAVYVELFESGAVANLHVYVAASRDLIKVLCV